jgi:hypothetical protein
MVRKTYNPPGTSVICVQMRLNFEVAWLLRKALQFKQSGRYRSQKAACYCGSRFMSQPITPSHISGNTVPESNRGTPSSYSNWLNIRVPNALILHRLLIVHGSRIPPLYNIHNSNRCFSTASNHPDAYPPVLLFLLLTEILVSPRSTDLSLSQ